MKHLEVFATVLWLLMQLSLQVVVYQRINSVNLLDQVIVQLVAVALGAPNFCLASQFMFLAIKWLNR